MRTILIADIHNRWEWAEKYLEKETTKDDEIVFLGDYFDNFQDTPKIAQGTARWLKGSLRAPNRVHLLGNHDAWYALPKQEDLLGTGFTEEKRSAINTILAPEDWAKIKMAHWTQGFWCSHAGLPPTKTPKAAAALARKLEKTWQKLLGENRGASPGKKTPHHIKYTLWARWADFMPQRHVHQIVGHTIVREPAKKIGFGDLKEKNSKDPEVFQIEYYETGFCYRADIDLYTASMNVCLDTHNRHIGIIEGGKLKTIPNPIPLPPEPEPSPEELRKMMELKEQHLRARMEAMLMAQAMQW